MSQLIKKKIWSFSTTVRNPERIENFTKQLSILKDQVWNDENQQNFQSLLIQSRLYVPTSENLNEEQQKILEDINIEMTFEQAKDIFVSKKYSDPSMRGRTSFAPIEKTGLAFIETTGISKKDRKKFIKISKTGQLLLDNKIDLTECMFKSLIKLQYPNPTSTDFTKEIGYDIKPFLAILSFIIKAESAFKKEKIVFNGITKNEFGIFALSLCDYNLIDKQVQDLVKFRQEINILKTSKEKSFYTANYQSEYLKEFINAENLKDYVDNTLRNFRLTGYLRVRGNGNYIDIEKNRLSQIEQLIKEIGVSANFFSNKEEYQEYIGDYDTPSIPWENITDLSNIFNNLKEKIIILSKNNKELPIIERMNNVEDVKTKIKTLRQIYAELINNTEYDHYKENKQKLINDIRINEDPIELERLITFGLKILIDENNITSNCPMGDDGFPTSHAPSKMPDIEMFDKDIFGITEVTMMTNRGQFYAEGQPVLRHHVDFIKKYNKESSYCLFIAPSIHRDTQNAFWTACKYEHEGKKRKIVPITIEQFCKLLENKNKKEFTDFMEKSTNVNKIKDSIEWLSYISNMI
jgi:hypothetical protein